MKLSSAPYYDHATHWKCSSIPNLDTGARYVLTLIYSLFHRNLKDLNVDIFNVGMSYVRPNTVSCVDLERLI